MKNRMAKLRKKEAGFILSILLSGSLFAQSPRTLTLPEAIAEARQHNPVLRAEQLSIQSSLADVVTAGLRPNPVLNNQTLQLVKPSAFPENTGALNNRNRQVWWQLTTPVNVARKRQKAVALAEQGVELTRRNVAETERNLLLEVGNQWLDAWSARLRLDLILEARQNIDTLVTINQVRLRNQVITKTDLLRTQILADQYRLRSQTTRQEYQNQLLLLKRLLGTSDSLDVAVNDTTLAWTTGPADTLITRAHLRRADVRLAEQAMEVAVQNTRLQEALRAPQPEVGAIYNPQNSVPYVGFYGTLPLPFFNKNQGGIQKAKVQQEQTRQVADYTRLQVQTEVQTAYRSYLTQRGNIDRYAGILQQSEQILTSVRYAYLKGGTTIVDYLEAQRSWLDVQQTYLDAQEAYRRSLLQLWFVTGQMPILSR
ncbi:TolC family protein [Larkinella rosea]|uniref:TolC family protein n=2 Tax=Larkinella rosea TaxID=2025312 RepID=A0A3P1BG81_9BACT|nr:TolC family protein [Larkinella rosea]